jgi:hypothetical protein
VGEERERLPVCGAIATEMENFQFPSADFPLDKVEAKKIEKRFTSSLLQVLLRKKV